MRDKIDFTPDYGTRENHSNIKVIGVGGGGGNAVEHMYSDGIVGVDFIVCNTDRQDVELNRVPTKLVLGEDGLGAGNNPEKARILAEESKDRIKEMIGEETKMVFVTAGMGKGTGTGAGPVVAQVAHEMGILTVGVVTYPFFFQGKSAREQADAGIAEMRKHVDSLIIIKNENLIRYYNDLDVEDAYVVADDVLKNAVKSIAELITVRAIQNVDFNDVKTVLQDSGDVVLGLATAEGENRINEVVDKALTCPLINEELITDAKRFLFFVTYGTNKLRMEELNELTKKFEEIQSDDTKLIWGLAKDESLGESIKLAVIIANYRTEEEKNKEKETISVIDENENKTENHDDIFDPESFNNTQRPEPISGGLPWMKQIESNSAPKQSFMPDNAPINMQNNDHFNTNAQANIPTPHAEIQFTSGPQHISTAQNFPNFDDDYERPAILRQMPQNNVQTLVMDTPHSITMEDDSHDLIFRGLPD
ncbi:MAG: cell division protein FtsZ [Bacteroidales bacterium]|nr:cell division protein FtsZ [Bacteroidales bacterium]